MSADSAEPATTPQIPDGYERVPQADPQPRRLLISLFGLFVRSEVSWISVAALVRLLGDLGVGAQAVRSSISRLKRRGTLLSSKRGGAAGYSPSPELQYTLAEGDRRIFGTARAELADGWVMVIFSVPEEVRKQRHALRSALSRYGFGIMTPGVWIAPGTVAAEAERMLSRRGLGDYVHIARGELLDAGSLEERVRQWWNLPELADQYQGFIDHYGPLAQQLRSGSPEAARGATAADNGAADRSRTRSSGLADDGVATFTDQEAFALYVPIVTAWRRLPYLDPGLPLELLPAPWPGARATALFHELHDALATPAHRYVTDVVAGIDS